jgi:hypothetical protein
MINFKTIRAGCPHRVVLNTGKAQSHCRVLLGHPSGSRCKPENCAALYVADLLINELRAEVMTLLKGRKENVKNLGGNSHEYAEVAETSPERDKG